MADASQELLTAIETLDEVAGSLTPQAAAGELDETSLQVFWREWPRISSWAGSLWRQLNEELAEAASPAEEGGVDTGGGD